MDWIPNHTPINNIINDAINLILICDIFFESQLPRRTTARVEQIRAKAAPAKTRMGLPDWADKSNVAIWVLSPNSARNTLINVEIKILKKPLIRLSLAVSKTVSFLTCTSPLSIEKTIVGPWENEIH